MSPDDPRHGTYAGAVAHYRMRTPTCPPCREAKRTYSTRNAKEVAMGRSRYTDATLLTRHVHRLLGDGMTQADIARAAGCAPETIRRLQRAELRRVHINTFQRIAAVRPNVSETFMPRTIAARKIQALAAIGYTLTWTATQLGITPQSLANILHDYKPNAGRVQRRTWDAIAALYDHHHMIPGPSQRARNIAKRNGWAPPLAWDDIDDLDEQPSGHLPTSTLSHTADRAETIRELVDRGAQLSEALRVIGVSVEALEKWADRHGMRAEFNVLKGRETTVMTYRNQHTKLRGEVA